MKFTLMVLFILLLSLSIGQAQSIYSSDTDSDVLADTGYVPDPELVQKMNPRKNLHSVSFQKARGLPLSN